MLNKTQLSELVFTRIYHDIIGNIGAVANGVELLEEGDLDFLDSIRSILKVGSGVIRSRLQFFRLAFGEKNANLQDMEGVRTTAQNYLNTLGKPECPISLEWKDSPIDYLRIGLVAIMIMGDIIIKGGSITVEAQGDKFYIIGNSVQAPSDDKIKEITDCLHFEDDISPQQAPILYLKELLKDSGYSIGILNIGTLGFVIFKETLS